MTYQLLGIFIAIVVFGGIVTGIGMILGSDGVTFGGLFIVMGSIMLILLAMAVSFILSPPSWTPTENACYRVVREFNGKTSTLKYVEIRCPV